MGFQVDLLTGLGEYLHAENVGRWSPTGTYGPNDVAITIDELPASPDKAIALGLYPVEDTGTTDTIQGLQLYIRGGHDRISAKDITDRAFDALHDLQDVVIGGIPIVRIWRNSGAPLGTDGNGRQEATQNYYLQLTRTGSNRRD